jgi:predicted amidohydrolase YtcJ
MDGSVQHADAMIVDGGRFACVGSETDVRDWASGKGAFDVLDLDGRLVIPGFNDSHMHFVHFARSAFSVSLFGTRSLRELKERMKAGLAKRTADPKTWLEGEGWNQDFFEDGRRFPNCRDLDEISRDVPILVMRTCFHAGVLNSAGMRLAGITRESVGSFGGLAETFPDGEPNGVIKEKFLEDLKSGLSQLNHDILKEIIIPAQDRLLAQGITSVQSDDFGYVENSDYRMLFGVFRELEDEGRLRIRVAEQCLLQEVSLLDKFFGEGFRAGWGTDFFRVACVKLLSDGGIGASTAALRNPYAGDPSNRGIMMFTQDELDELVSMSHRRRTPVAIHAIGDRAMEMSLRAIAKANTEEPALRHGLVHCQITDAGILDRMGEIGVHAFVQPKFIDYEMDIVEDRVGPELAETSYAWKSMIDRGVRVSFSTDCPVEPIDTMPNIYSAVTRKKIGGERVYLPRERVSVLEAVRAYTAEGAYATYEENLKGSITAGKLADFIVLDKNLFEIENDEILKTRVLATYVGGELAYSL